MIDTTVRINLMAEPPKQRKPRRKARHSRNDSGSLHLIPLPFGLGLYYGKGFGCWRVRSWEWARYDLADYDPQDSERWARVQLTRYPEAAHPIAAAWDKYQSRSLERRLERWGAK